MAAGGDLEVYQIAYNHSNYPGELGSIMNDFKAKFNDDFYTFSIYNGIVLLGDAMAKLNQPTP